MNENEQENEKRDEIADILEEMRERADAMQTHGTTHGVRLAIREFAERLEAAWKREARAIATEHAVLPAVCITKPHGNAAAIREALQKIREKCVIYNNDLAEEIDALCGNALYAPARNCDIHANNHDAWLAWEKHCEDSDMYDEVDEVELYGQWLFSPAAARKGEGNGK